MKMNIPRGISYNKNKNYYVITDYTEKPKGKYAGKASTLEEAVEILGKLKETGESSVIRNPERIKGISFHKPTKKWALRRTINGKQTHLGLFETKELAETYALTT